MTDYLQTVIYYEPLYEINLTGSDLQTNQSLHIYCQQQNWQERKECTMAAQWTVSQEDTTSISNTDLEFKLSFISSKKPESINISYQYH